MFDLIVNFFSYKKIKDTLAEVKPPWVLFPGCQPPPSLRADMHREWFEIVWTPYWESLDYSEQCEYLDKWDAPVNWEAYLHPTLCSAD